MTLANLVLIVLACVGTGFLAMLAIEALLGRR